MITSQCRFTNVPESEACRPRFHKEPRQYRRTSCKENCFHGTENCFHGTAATPAAADSPTRRTLLHCGAGAGLCTGGSSGALQRWVNVLGDSGQRDVF